jgi:hypothetical protein
MIPGRGRIENRDAFRYIYQYRYIIAFTLLMLPVVVVRYDYFTMDADVGVYAIRGMQIESERNLFSKNQIRGLLHGKIRDRYDSDNLLSFDKATKGGVYLPGTHLVPTEDSLFYFHAYPAWPVFLAIWGSIFGIANQHYVMIVLYALIVPLLYFVLQSLSSNSRLSTLLTILFGSSPLLVYFTKYGTSELLLLFLVLFTIHLLADSHYLNMLFAGLSVTLFCLIHVSSFVYTPLLFLAVYFFMNSKQAERYYIFLIISFLGFMLSIPYGYYVSRNYFIDIYVFTFSSLKLGVALVVFIGIIGLVMSTYGCLVYRKKDNTADEII